MQIGIADMFERVIGELQDLGFLLESDPHLPSVCSLVTGELMRGSWWSHPLAHTIFAVNERLADHADVVITKLVSGKVTFVHRQLWSELITIGSSRSQWQLKGLSSGEAHLLGLIEADGELRTDMLDWPARFTTKPGDAARQLEQRLLVVSLQVHTEKGAHAKLMQTWKHWSSGVQFKPKRIRLDDAISAFETRVARLNSRWKGVATLPWTKQ